MHTRRWGVLTLVALATVATVAASQMLAGAATAKPRGVTRVRATTTVTYPAATVADVRAEADWIATAQMADGAIAHYTDKVKVWPYVANYAAIGLARATSVTGDTAYAKASWRWLQWYGSHEDGSGFVTDYNVSNGTLVSTGDMDSTDAYAGTFLYAAWTTWSANKNLTALKALRPAIDGAVKAIAATTDTDGLTWAKPAWHVKYLMDEAETYAGLRSATKLYAALGDTTSSKSTNAKAARMKTAIDALWNSATSSYDWAVHDTGVRQTTDWTKLYPDSLEQMWAVAFGLTDATRRTQLTAELVANHPQWATPNASDQPDATSYWPLAGWAFGQTDASNAAATIKSFALNASRAWPYTPGIAGQQIVLLSGGPSLP